MSDYRPAWVELDGVVNMRDLGGLPARDGRQVRPRRMLRSDNLAELSDESVQILLEDYRLSDVTDLRTNIERDIWGVGPMLEQPQVKVHNLSLYPEDNINDGIPPWAHDFQQMAKQNATDRAVQLAQHYLNYLVIRPDSVLGALRVLGKAEGGVIVNCTAGKDRTGLITALALSSVGVPDDLVVADYEVTNVRLPQILERTGKAAGIGAGDVTEERLHGQATPAATMEYVLERIEDSLGGVENWLDSQGWTGDDQARLESHLLDE